MSQVIGTLTKTLSKFGFRTNIFGKEILQICMVCQDWDTNTGCDDGPKYTSWRDATRHEAETFLLRKENV